MVRVGLAGLGFMGGTHAQCHAALPNAELVAVVDVEPDRRERFAATYGAKPFASLEEMLSSVEVDMVDICMPTYLHRKAVEQVAAAGRQVLCEKPMALTVEDCDAMIAATKKAKVKFMIGQVLRFWPEYRTLMFAAVILLILLYMPEGLIPWVRDKIEKQCPRCKLRNVAMRKTCRVCTASLD